MIRKIDHIGIAVHDLHSGIQFYRDVLGLSFHGTEIVPEQKVEIAIFLAGDVRIELLAPTDDDSPVARFLAKRGEGVHHIAYQVDRIQETLDALQTQGIHLVDDRPKTGAGGAQIAFLHPRSTLGVLTELCQPGEK